jgi:hypothetical protein
VAFIVGLLIGLVVLGWWLWPVQWTDATPDALASTYEDIYVRNVAELYAFDGNQDKVRAAYEGWGGDVAACQLAVTSTDPADQQRLIAAATVVNGQGCANVGAPPEEAGAGSNLLPTLFLLLLLLLLLGAIVYVFSRRSALLGGTGSDRTIDEGVPGSIPASTRRPPTPTGDVQEPVAIPIARFRTNYSRGHDTYDDSFSIENKNGDFLGECGVGISETIGADSPKNVTAFEVWLFDKNDIRTITKVIMSDHAFFDEAIKAKLAPKGEPVLAREHETIVLETASLIINAEITEMEYSVNNGLPENSTFDQFTIELSAWVKEGEYGDQEAVGDADDVLNY